VWGSDPGHAFAVGTVGTVWSSTTMGANWAEGTLNPNLGTPPDAKAIWGSSLTSIFAVGDQGFVYHSTDGGGSWDKLRMPPVGGPAFANLKAVWGVTSNNVYIGQDSLPLLHFDGANFTTETPAAVGCSGDFCWSIWGSGAGDVYAVGDGTQHWDGTTWSTLVLPGSHGVANAVWGSSKNDVFIVANDTTTGGIVYHSTDGGMNWGMSTFPSNQITAVSGTSPNDIYVGSNGGKVWHSADDGNSWQGPVLTGAPYIWQLYSIDAAHVLAAGQNQILYLK
jgi:photosystem II stability/assembly factor-like uncharacterized protein